MKKFKYFFTIALCLIMGCFLVACDGNKNKTDSKYVYMQTLTLCDENGEISGNEINIRENGSVELTVSYGPSNATNVNVEWLLTDSTYVSLVVDTNNQYKATVTVNNNLTGPDTTYLQVKSLDGNARSKSYKICSYKESIQLSSPQNFYYNVESETLIWDDVSVASGYELDVGVEGHNEQVFCPTNQYKISPYYGKVISVKVRCLGDGVIYTDSEFSDSLFNFIQLPEPENLRYEDGAIKFDKVENAGKYIIRLYDSTNQISYRYEINDSDYYEDIGYVVDKLDQPAVTFNITVESVAYDLENVTEYSSKVTNQITVGKFATPLKSNDDFKFTYNKNIISWKKVNNASGYILTRICGSLKKTYTFDADTTFMIIDTVDDKLDAGKYKYTLQILGDGSRYITSNTSDALSIEKLPSPQLQVLNGKINWTEVENCGGYYLKINGGSPLNYDSSVTNYELGLKYGAGQYSFSIASKGNGSNTITSEYSNDDDLFIVEKLYAPETLYLDNNRELVICGSEKITNLVVSLTHNGRAYSINCNALTLNGDGAKEARIDLSQSKIVLSDSEIILDNGTYMVYAVAFANTITTTGIKGYLYSNPSENLVVEKLNNPNNAEIVEGETLQYTLPYNAVRADVYINGTLRNDIFDFIDEKYVFNNSIEIIPNSSYELSFVYYPVSESNYIISNTTLSFEFTKLKTPSIRIENSLIKYTASTTNFKIEVTEYGETSKTIYSDFDSIKLDEKTVYQVKMYLLGDNNTLKSDYSNTLTVKLIDEINDLHLDGDTVSFTDIGASNYEAILAIPNENKTFIRGIERETSFSLSYIIKFWLNSYMENVEYNELTENQHLTISVISSGTNLGLENNTTYLVSREQYGNSSLNLQNSSNVIKLKLLPTPKTIFTTSLIEVANDNRLEINALYFTCRNTADLFLLNYVSNDGLTTGSQLLSVGNGLLTSIKTEEDITTYMVDTTFLPSGTFTLTIKSVSSIPTTITDPQNSNYTYVIDSLDTLKGENFIKLETPTISCANNQITITNGNSSYLYLFTHNGNVIYDDISLVEENCTIDDILALANEDITSLISILQAYQSSTRTLPQKYNGTFSLGLYAYQVPTDLANLAIEITNQKTTQNIIRSNMAENLTLTRLNAPTVNIVNGCITFKEIVNATSYELYFSDTKGSEGFVYDKPLRTISWNETDNKYDFEDKDGNITQNSLLSFNIYDYLSGESGEYEVYLNAISTEANTLNSVSTHQSISILQTPRLKVVDGVVIWNSVDKAKGYLLIVYDIDAEGNATEKTRFIFDNNVITYDCMKTLRDSVIEGGREYGFSISAISVLNEEENESSVMHSKTSDIYRATKLDTPSAVYVENGLLTFTKINLSSAVSNYQLFVFQNDGEDYLTSTLLGIEVVSFTGNSYSMELPEEYEAGEYIFVVQAMAKGNYLKSNISEAAIFEKLPTTTNVYVQNGEIYWEQVEFENYNIVYSVNVDGNSISEENPRVDLTFTQTNTYYAMSSAKTSANADKYVPSGSYTLNVQVLGNDYYINSNRRKLENVVKLDSVYNFNIKDGKLSWAKPSLIAGIGAENNASPYGYELIIEQMDSGRIFTYTLQASENSFAMDYISEEEIFEAGLYNAKLVNIGSQETNLEGYSYVNSETILCYSSGDSNLLKLAQVENVSINDGINLTWANPNGTFNYENKYVVEIKHTIGETTNVYSGILQSSTNRFTFDKITYFVLENEHNPAEEVRNVLILKDDARIKKDENNYLYYEEYVYGADGTEYLDKFYLHSFSFEGSFDVTLYAYGGDVYLTSSPSEALNITLPDPVTDLKVTHGKVTWTGTEDANGYIVSIKRYAKDGVGNYTIEDAAYNAYNETIYLSADQKYYNLSDVNYKYIVGVRAYSLYSLGEDEEEGLTLNEIENKTLASESIEIEYVFDDTFSNGAGTAERPYEIENATQLTYMYYNNFAHYVLVDDIDLSPYTNFATLFTEEYAFVGVLDGNGKSISNLKITSASELSTGLLGYISTLKVNDSRLITSIDEYNNVLYNLQTTEISYLGKVKNLTLDSVNIIDGVMVGALAGYSSGEIDNVTVSGNIAPSKARQVDIGASFYTIYSGSIVATNYGTIKRSTNNANIMPTAETILYTGGITSINYGIIYDCVNNGSIAGTIAGGISATNQAVSNVVDGVTTYINGIIEACKVTGDIACYNYSSKTGTSQVSMAGGIAGENKKGSYILNCLVNNPNYERNNHGIMNTSTADIDGKISYLGALVADNAGYCENNLIYENDFEYSVTLNNIKTGLVIGYNSGYIANNYYRIINATSEQLSMEIYAENDGSIPPTNCVVSSINDLNTISDLNNFNLTNTSGNSNITWKLEDNEITFSVSDT